VAKERELGIRGASKETAVAATAPAAGKATTGKKGAR
jgi:hypothetical protein